MTNAEKIKELERRIRELEARPVYVPIYIGAPQPYLPCPQPNYPQWPYPWNPSWTTYGGMGGDTTLIGNGPHSVTYGMSEGGIG